MPFEFDAWGVDVAVSGVPKGFMLATGMAIVCASPKAWLQCNRQRCHAHFDFRDMIEASGGFPYTPPLPLIYGLSHLS